MCNATVVQTAHVSGVDLQRRRVISDRFGKGILFHERGRANVQSFGVLRVHLQFLSAGFNQSTDIDVFAVVVSSVGVGFGVLLFAHEIFSFVKTAFEH